jgi:hypothetical protein
MNQKKYALDFKDNDMRWMEIDYFAKEDKSFKSYCSFEKVLETQYGIRIKALCSNQVAEF